MSTSKEIAGFTNSNAKTVFWPSIGKSLLYLVLFFWALVSIFPFWWLLVCATRKTGDMFNIPLPLLPGTSLLDNIKGLFTSTLFLRQFINSIFVGITGTASQLFLASLAGYAFAKFDVRHKEKFFLIILATMMIPGQLTLIPGFLLMSRFHWLNTYWALLIPGLVGAFGIFWMRQYINEAVPSELLDSARVDGCHELMIFLRIVFPVITPALAALGTFTFLGWWNDFLWPMIVMREPAMYTLPVALRFLITNYMFDYSKFMVGTALATFPMIVAFLVASKKFIAGLTAGALK
ncbi:MAG: carbohydrate ABC transporter permease [Patescibacteria group bacterium]